MCSPASVILTSIATILVSFEAILKKISVNFNIRSQFQSNFPTISFEIDQNRFKTYKYCDNTCEYYTCRWTHFSSIGSILVSIISILTSIATILASIEQVNRPLVTTSHISHLNLTRPCILSLCLFLSLLVGKQLVHKSHLKFFDSVEWKLFMWTVKLPIFVNCLAST